VDVIILALGRAMNTIKTSIGTCETCMNSIVRACEHASHGALSDFKKQLLGTVWAPACGALHFSHQAKNAGVPKPNAPYA
jgi:hypothetical protein